MNQEKWEQTHTDPRFLPRFPHEVVIQWTFRNFPMNKASSFKLLDVGCGAGRHALFWAKEGYNAFAVDYSSTGIAVVKERAAAQGLRLVTEVCSADNLLIPDNSIDGLLCFGVLYYLSYDLVEKALQEFHRVLKPGGKMFLITRTNEDSRIQHTEYLGNNMYKILSLSDDAPSKAEEEMTMTFLSDQDIRKLLNPFHSVAVDRLYRTYADRKFVDDDWLICAVK